MAKTIVGLFDSRDAAQRVADDLVNQGYSRADIDISAAEGDAATAQRSEKRGGFLSWLFGGDDYAEDYDTYDEGIRRGRTAVAVHADDDEEDDVAAIMDRHGPLDINTEAAQWRAEGWAGSGRAGSIPVVKEDVAIGKRAVERGGVRIYSRVVERPVTEDVSLRDEEVNVERRPVDRPLQAGDEAFKDRVIEMRETEEEPVVSKTARVVEEVNLSKEERERKERVEASERHTEVEVEHLKSGEKPSEQPRRP